MNEPRLDEAARQHVFECFAASGLMMWFWPDCSKRNLCFAGVMMKTLGYGPGDLESDYDTWLALIHPDERGQLEHAMAAILAGTHSGEFEARYRMRRKDGSYVTVRGTVSVVKRRDSEGLSAFGLIRVLEPHEQSNRPVSHLAHDALDVVLDRIGHAVILLTADGRVVHENETAKGIAGYESGGVPGTGLCRFLHETDGSSIAPDLLSTVVSSAHQAEREIFRFNRWWHVHLVPLSNPQDAVDRVLLLAQDITAKKAEQNAQLAHEKTLSNTLVREIHHRVKNHLQGLIGLMRTYAQAQLSTREVIDSAVAQILSIATVHSLLARDGRNSVEFAELVTQIVATLRVSSPVPIQFDFADARWRPTKLSQEEAVPLAIVIGELCTNAIKHTRHVPGATICGRLVNEGDEIDFTISNSPAQLPPGFQLAADGRSSAGLDVVQALLPRGRSRLEVFQENAGVTTRLRLRAAPAALPTAAH
ncbi:MAG: PAS domain-containing protein [Gammaproteobacteria bacterium]